MNTAHLGTGRKEVIFENGFFAREGAEGDLIGFLPKIGNRQMTRGLD